jgi:regulator of sigma E protease
MLDSLDWLRSPLAILFVFGIVVFVHEFGHFLAAKWMGVYAPRFSIGFGPALWRRRWGETEYIVAALPLGGYVRMASRDDETMAMLEGGGEKPAHAPDSVGGSGAQVVPDESVGLGQRRRGRRDYDPEALAPFGPKPVPEHRMFESKSLPARLFIMLAGVTMNILLAFVVLSGLAFRSGEMILHTRVVGAVSPLPAVPQLASQLRAGDTIQAVNGQPVENWNEIIERVQDSPSEPIVLRTNRGEVTIPVGENGISRNDILIAIQPFLPPVIDVVAPDRPGERGGLRPGDSIVAVSSEPVGSWPQVVAKIESAPGQELIFEVVRDGTRQALRIRPDSTRQQNPVSGREEFVGKIGASRRVSSLEEQRALSLGSAVAAGWRSTWGLTGLVIEFVKDLFTGQVSLRGVGGPITIARASAEAARSGFERLLQLTAFLSINLAVLNLLPIPILDGGQIVLNIVEAARGSAFSTRTREYILRFGLLIILLIFSLAMYNDITSWVRDLVAR